MDKVSLFSCILAYKQIPTSSWYSSTVSLMLQDLDAVASGEWDVVTLKRAIANGDISTVVQHLDKGMYSLYFMCDN